MKRILLSPALAAILLVLTFAPCLAGESASPSAALYEHGLDIVSLMVEMAQSDAYISAFSGSGTLHDIVSGICADFVNTDIAAPKAVYALTMDSDALLEMAGLSDASGLSPALADYLDHRLLAAIPSQLSAASGAETLAAVTICMANKTFVCEGASDVIYFYTYEDAVPAAVTFITGEDDTVTATGIFIVNDSLSLDSADGLAQFLEPMDVSIEQLDL